MLTELRFHNFRCFEDHSVPLRPCTVIVGKNNAGKSTLVEGLRLISVAASRFLSLGIHDPPTWSSLPKREMGVSPSLDGLELNTTNLFHRYGSPPASITATFDTGAALRVYVWAQANTHAVLFGPDEAVVKTRAKAREILSDRVEIMPQVAPVELEEFVLNTDYVRRNLSSSLAPRHFRNQVSLLHEKLIDFKKIAEDTWPGLQVRDLLETPHNGRRTLSLNVRNDDYVAEIATMGHGLQMWLQTMWFLARVDSDATVILDEPDVYMHPDLQRRLIRHLRTTRKQIVVTTHSVEIMSEVNPEDILVLDRRRPRSSFASAFPAAQQVLDHVGSAHNLQLSRLWHARKSLLVEGSDFRLLTDFFDVLYPDDRDGLAVIPHMSIGGWNGFPYAIGSSLFLKNAGGERIAVYCILDSDYHTPAQKKMRREQAARGDVRLHIWERKEIENYLLDPRPIQRAIQTRAAKRVIVPTVAEVEAALQTICEDLHDDVFDAFCSEYLLDDRKGGISAANKAARNHLLSLWSEPESRLSAVPGKIAFGAISKWAQDEFGVSLNASLVARSFRSFEVQTEIRSVLEAIAFGQALPPSSM